MLQLLLSPEVGKECFFYHLNFCKPSDLFQEAFYFTGFLLLKKVLTYKH